MSRYSQNAQKYASLAAGYARPRRSELSKPIKDKGADNWRTISEIAGLLSNTAPIGGAIVGGIGGLAAGGGPTAGLGAIPGMMAGASAGGAAGAGVGQALKGISEWTGAQADQPMVDAQAKEEERLRREEERAARMQMVMSLMGRR